MIWAIRGEGGPNWHHPLLSCISSKMAPRCPREEDPRGFQEAPKTASRRPKMTPRRPKRLARRLQEDPKTAQEAPKAALRVQESPKTAQERFSRRPPRGFRMPPRCPLDAPRAPRGLQETPTCFQEVREGPHPSFGVLVFPPGLARMCAGDNLINTARLGGAFLDGLVGIREASRISLLGPPGASLGPV